MYEVFKDRWIVFVPTERSFVDLLNEGSLLSLDAGSETEMSGSETAAQSPLLVSAVQGAPLSP